MTVHPDIAAVRRPAGFWHLITLVVIAVCLVTQLVMTVRGIAVLIDENGKAVVATPMRLVRFFTYFTIESNIVAMVMAASLIVRPDRDGKLWRVARVASVVGMTVTFVVYRVALAGLLDLHGVAWWTDFGFHVVAPLLTVVGWLLFGPRRRFDIGSVAWFLAWPVCWIGYVLILGAATGWYPYPFLDAGDRGYPHALLNCLLVAILLLGVGAAFTVVDQWLSRKART